MKALTSDIRFALHVHLPYLAVMASLAVPDICGAIESPDGLATGAKYRAWFDAWLGAQYRFVTGDDVYYLRCGVLHQGRLGHPKMQFDRIIVTTSSALEAHNVITTDSGTGEQILTWHAADFCSDVIAATERWYSAKRNDPHVMKNMPRLVQYRPSGYGKSFVGRPVIT